MQAGPLRLVPIAALGAVLVKAALSLVDLEGLREIYRIDRPEFALSIIATLGVVAVGAIDAILIAARDRAGGGADRSGATCSGVGREGRDGARAQAHPDGGGFRATVTLDV